MPHVYLDTMVPPKIRDTREANVTEITKGNLRVVRGQRCRLQWKKRLRVVSISSRSSSCSSSSGSISNGSAVGRSRFKVRLNAQTKDALEMNVLSRSSLLLPPRPLLLVPVDVDFRHCCSGCCHCCSCRWQVLIQSQTKRTNKG